MIAARGGGGGRGTGRRQRQERQHQTPPCIQDIKDNGWWDPDHGGVAERRVMRKELFDPGAQEIANRCGVTTSQLRRFYDELKGLDVRVQSLPLEKREKHFAAVLPLVKKVKATASYASKRQGGISDFFREFLHAGIDQVEHHKDLHAFVLVFEAVAGYAKK